jgi:predicted nucleic acid-binding Zn ribbon protein
MERKKTCPVCGDEFSGRIDKKFCSDQCRNEFNNRRYQETNNYIRQINYALRKNRRILQELNPIGKTKVPRRKLLDRGFDFTYFTNVHQTRTGNTYYFCYEQGYLPLGDDFYTLVIKD